MPCAHCAQYPQPAIDGHGAQSGVGSDITALWTLEGWLSIAIVADLFSRKVVGWACAASMATWLVMQALQMAIGQRHPKAGLLHHSDRGSQYAIKPANI